MVQKFVQPDYGNAAQTGSIYPTNIDKAIAVLAEQAAQFAVAAQDTPNMTVAMRAGRIAQANGTTLAVAAQNSAALTAPTVNPRNDVVYYDTTTGVIGVAAGTEAASPVDPTTPDGKTSVARIRWTVGMASITNSAIDDLRTSPLPPLLGRFQVFNVSGTFIAKATGAHLVIAIGGGGGGGGGAGVAAAVTASGGGGAGGGAGRWTWAVVNLTLAQSVAVAIGAGGAGGTADNAGNAGGNTDFGALVSVSGGAFGYPGVQIDSNTSRGERGGTGGGFGGGYGGLHNTAASNAGSNGASGTSAGAGGGGGGGATNNGGGVQRNGGPGGNGSAGLCIVIW